MTSSSRDLARFAVEATGDSYLVTLEDAAGAVTRFACTQEQLDVLADLIDDALGTAAGN